VSAARVIAAVVAREWLRMGRQPVRVAAAVLTPVIVLLGLGGGFAGSLGGLSSAGYAGFLLPGVIAMAALFASIFGCFSLIQDRDHGPLPVVLVAPVPRWSVGVGKALGVGSLAAAQAGALLPAAWIVGLEMSPAAWLSAAGAVVLLSLGAAGPAVALAWRCPDAASFHSLLNVVFLPAWMLAGAFYPAESASGLVRWATVLNPLAWPVAALRQAMTGHDSMPGEPGLWWILAGVFAIVGLLAAARVGRVKPRRM
jgi:ABC-type polysaccharide/polyol phosphate export permease